MVQLAYETSDNEISFTIKDEGDGFNFNSLPDPTDPENIDKPNGRGVFLMKNLADTVEFENNGSTVKIRFKVI
jgi:serine/threonine-protein kinase RsbW